MNARVCTVTGLQVENHAANLIKLHAVSAVVFLLLGALAALGIALTRWEAVHLLSPDWYYRLVSFHGVNMLVFWIVFFESAGIVFASTVILNSRQAFAPLAYLAWFLMLAGALMADWVMLFKPFDQATIMFTAYPPLKSHPAFYLGVILFAVGALVNCILFFLNVFNARREGTHTGPVPLFTYAIGAAATIGVYALLHGALAFIPAFLWSMGWIKDIDPAAYRLTFWGFGHPAQQINLCAMVGVWYALSTFTVGALPVNEKVCRTAFVLYVLFINLGSVHHLLVDPGLGAGFKIFNTSYAMYLAVLASMIHALSIPASVEVAQRKRGYTKGLFEWLKQAPWGNPCFAALALSLVIFGFLGGVSGVIIGTAQVNLQAHNTLRIPGHFHTTVVGGTTLAFMGFTYYVIPLIFRKEWWSPKWAKVQPWLFAAGIVVMALAMSALGMLGYSRRHYDMSLEGAPFQSDQFGGVALLFQALVGLGGTAAVASVVMFALNAVATLLLGKAVETVPSFPPVQLPTPEPEGAPEQPRPKFAAPGVFALAIAFLVFFVVMYAANWLSLAKTWEIK